MKDSPEMNPFLSERNVAEADRGRAEITRVHG